MINTRQTDEALIAVLQPAVNRIVEKAGVNTENLLGIGVGVPGITRQKNGSVSFSPSTGWRDRPVQKELESIFGLPVIVENDVNLMALGELRQGAGKGISNMVYIHVGTGIGAGIIIDGRLYRGAADAAGEIGYFVLGDPAQRNLPESGIFESNYSAKALADRIVKEFGKEWIDQARQRPGGVINLLEEMGHQSPGLRQLLEEACRYWAYGIANMVCMMNPELVILGGDMVYLGEWGLAAIQEKLTELAPVAPLVRYAALGDNAGVIGAVFQVMENDRSLTGRKS